MDAPRAVYVKALKLYMEYKKCNDVAGGTVHISRYDP
jgi:hypothetical protein